MQFLENSLSATPLVTLTLGALASVSAAGGVPAGPGSLCADSGHCYLDRWLPDAAGPDQRFGGAVEILGDTAVIGSPGADRVEIYRLVAGYWSLEQVIDSPAGPDADFGAELALFGDSLLIGAPGDDQIAADAGAAYLYTRAGGAFHLGQTLFSPLPEVEGHYGAAVDVGGFWLAVGEPDGGPSGRGYAYRDTGALYVIHDVFEEPGTGFLGCAIAIDDNDIAVGAYGDSMLGANAGAVYVYAVSPTSGTAVTKVVASDGMPGDVFGVSLDIDDDRLLVGAQGHDALANSGGAAYLFARDEPPAMAFGYTEIEKFLPCDPLEFAFFGADVALKDGRAVVGAPIEDGFQEPGGKAYVFRRGGIFAEAWDIEDQLRVADGALGDGFGVAVGISGTQVLIGAHGVDEVDSGAGAAYLFSMSYPEFGGGACGCNAIAGVTSFGTGKPGTAGVPELSLNKPLVLNGDTLVGVSQVEPGLTPLLVWGFQSAEIPFDNGVLYVADPHLIAMPTSLIGQVGMQIALGDAPALCGLEVFLQAFVVDPAAAGPFQTAQSNAVSMLIGQ